MFVSDFVSIEESFDLRSKAADSQLRENHFSILLPQTHSTVKMDFSSNPNLLINFENADAKNLAVGILVNQNHSCWVTNLGPDGFTEVYRLEGSVHRALAYNQVAYVRHGDLVAFGGRLFRLRFGFATIQFHAIQADKLKVQSLQ